MIEIETEEKTDNPVLLGIGMEEASARLGLESSVIQKLVGAGRLRGEKLGKRWYIDPALHISPPAPVSPQAPQVRPPLGANFGFQGGDPFFSLRSLPDDHVIEIYRLKQGKRYYVCSMTPEEFSLMAVQRDFGGGVFLAIGTSDGQAVAQHGFAVDGPEKHPDNPAQDRQVSENPISLIGIDQQSLQLQQLSGQVQALQQALMAMAAGASQPRESDESRKRWLEEMLLMKQIFPQPPAPPPPPPQISPEDARKRWLEEMMLLKQVFGGQERPDTLAAISGALMKGVEMAATVSAIGEHEGIGTALIKGMIPTLSEVIGGIAKNLVGPPTTSATPPEPLRSIQISTTNLPPPNGTPETSKDPQPEPSGLEMLLPAIKRAARENRDPYPYAAMIASELSEEAAGYLRAATSEQFQQFAATLDPGLAEHPGWVGELREAVRAELSEDTAGAEK